MRSVRQIARPVTLRTGRECRAIGSRAVAEELSALLTILDLEQIEVNIFRGLSPDETVQRVFGGQVAGQALIAAGRTVPEDRKVHSLHAYFLRPGDPAIPIVYEVDRIRDGRSFTTRRVVALQHGEAIFTLACSFHADEPGIVHQDPMPNVPGPESVPELEAAGVGSGRTGRVPLAFEDGSGLDVRYLAGPPWARDPLLAQKREQMWIRTRGRLPDEAILHAAAMTFASDLSLVGTILRRHPGESSSPGFRASLDHAVWFHRSFRADEWLFYDQVSPIAFGARGLAHGKLYKEDGTLVASVAQEGLVRSARGR